MSTENTVRLFHLPFSFMLPQRVAKDRGYFADEGLDVELVERDREDVDWKYIPAKETLIHDYDVDLYPVCKWESIKRTWDMNDGRIVANGTFADQPYTIYVKSESGIETPEDLADVAIGVNRRTGQEYTVIKALEEYLPPESIAVEHHGMPTDRLRALRDDEVAAISLLEPQSTLADLLGFRPVLQFENHVGIVGDDAIEKETLEAFTRAYARAVDDINNDPETFREEYLSMLIADADVAPDLFEDIDFETVLATIDVPTYESPELADPAELKGHLDWMKHRQFIDANADIDTIVGVVKR